MHVHADPAAAAVATAAAPPPSPPARGSRASGEVSGEASGEASGGGRGGAFVEIQHGVVLPDSRDSTVSWTREEHSLFLEGLQLYQRDWRRICSHIGTKSILQAQAYAKSCAASPLPQCGAGSVPTA